MDTSTVLIFMSKVIHNTHRPAAAQKSRYRTGETLKRQQHVFYCLLSVLQESPRGEKIGKTIKKPLKRKKKTFKRKNHQKNNTVSITAIARENEWVFSHTNRAGGRTASGMPRQSSHANYAQLHLKYAHSRAKLGAEEPQLRVSASQFTHRSKAITRGAAITRKIRAKSRNLHTLTITCEIRVKYGQ